MQHPGRDRPLCQCTALAAARLAPTHNFPLLLCFHFQPLKIFTPKLNELSFPNASYPQERELHEVLLDIFQ